MNLTAIIRLKEKIAISAEFTPKERDFALEAINIAIDGVRMSAHWRDIATAPRDGTPILVLLKNPLPVEGRRDLERWHGLAFVAQHWELPADGFDSGWQFAAPVGQGGFPDTWMVGWQALSPHRQAATRRWDEQTNRSLPVAVVPASGSSGRPGMS
jgi:hypothetical protein